MFKAAALGICFVGSAVRSEIIKGDSTPHYVTVKS